MLPTTPIEVQDRIHQLYEDDVDAQQIAAETGVRHKTVLKLIRVYQNHKDGLSISKYTGVKNRNIGECGTEHEDPSPEVQAEIQARIARLRAKKEWRANFKFGQLPSPCPGEEGD